jgi:hypothetical protein
MENVFIDKTTRTFSKRLIIFLWRLTFYFAAKLFVGKKFQVNENWSYLGSFIMMVRAQRSGSKTLSC